MIKISCHCANVVLHLNELPAQVRDCDCPMCNRLGALWGDFPEADVVVQASTPTETYRWGDGDYELHHCSKCGCSTHYTSIAVSDDPEIGVNMRMLDRRQLERIPIKGMA